MSRAIDAGDPAGCLDTAGLPLTTDQRGAVRPSDCGGGLRCDMGAYEGCASIMAVSYLSYAAESAPGGVRGARASLPYFK